MLLRPAQQSDLPFLEEILYEAVFWSSACIVIIGIRALSNMPIQAILFSCCGKSSEILTASLF